MNYLEFYENAKRRIAETLLSMWASGQGATQKYLNDLLKEEPLLAEPVFQATFPWVPSSKSFKELTEIFDHDFIDSLDQIKDPESRFPKDRPPYLHQVESWNQLLKQQRSIVVTSGTGSGKTECFMIPVLQDLLRQKKEGHKNGVQAIFLYPLNALMNSQQRRMKAWCEALSPQVSFAIYNGNTAEENISLQVQRQAYPELLTRKAIRSISPQILFTNPTMLEYMLVRKKDQEILRQSQGKLRWILLDETHTYSGSAAAELSMQIRRLLDAFGVTAEQVRFASTSATIGSDNETQLIRFIAQLIGKPENDIVVINGSRIIPDIIDQSKTNATIDKLRIDLTKVQALTAREIGNRFKQNATIEESLEIIDQLSNKISGLIQPGINDALLPTRGHFFIRSIGGIFICVNPKCTRHLENRPLIGSMTTQIRTLCDCCGAPLLELTACNSCGNHLLVAEKEQSHYPTKFRLPSKSEEELFDMNDPTDSDSDEDHEQGQEIWSRIVLAKGVSTLPSGSASLFSCGIDTENKTIIPNGDFVECIHETSLASLCPHCGNRTDRITYFRTGSMFLSRILSSSLLEQAEPMLGTIAGKLWQGRKYISFTDNRQGTAKSALAQNTEVERNWIRTTVFHYLSNKKREGNIPGRELNEVEQQEYNQLLPLRGQGINVIEDRLRTLEDYRSGYQVGTNPAVGFGDLCIHLDNSADLTILYRHISKHGHGQQHYLKALLTDQFGRRPRRGNSPETMGLIRMMYPGLQRCERPITAATLGWSVEDWRDFLKICIDFFVRENSHLIISHEIRQFITQDYYSNHLYAANCDIVDPRTHRRVKCWPSLNALDILPRERQTRLILLLCAAMGITDTALFNATNIDTINSILNDAWRQLTTHVLSITDTQNAEFKGYKLDLFENEKVKIELLEKAWFCPVTGTPMDTIFRGYSPTLKGNINADNFARYKVNEELFYPSFPYAFNEKMNSENILVPSLDKEVISWKDENLVKQMELGLWSNLHERIFLYYPIFLAAEHSAQQNKGRLKEIEEQFNDGKINILSCSTTMELGVDIGGISEVVMNNVPPKPANYLQRAGRAGRRAESKAMAVTFCASNPIGVTVINDPKWAMVHPTAMPIVKLESANLIQRHINSFLLGVYIHSIEGVDVTSSVGGFFYPEDNSTSIFNYSHFRKFLNDLLVNDNIELRKRYSILVAKTVKQSANLEQSIMACLNAIDSVYNRLNDRKKLLDDAQTELLGTNGYSVNSPEIRAIHYQTKQLLGQNLIGYLAETDFIPSAGIPTGIVDFNKEVYSDLLDEGSENNFFKQNPSLNITRALAEYAPGNQVIINEKCYDSAGIILKSEWSESRRAILQNCPTCGYSRLGNGVEIICPKCKKSEMQGIHSVGSHFTEVIEPSGFSVDYYSEPTRNIKNRNHQQNIIEPTLLNMDPWNEDITGNFSKIEIRPGNLESEILYYNKGNDYGFAVCIQCGRAARENGISGLSANPLENHTRLNGGTGEKNRPCKGNENHSVGIKRNVLIGGRLQTDFVEIRFRDRNNILLNDSETIWSLGVILSRKLSEYLGINGQEIGFNVKRYPFYSSLFIFDTAKGGAGYSSLFELYVPEILDNALKSLDECCCEKACINCLIDRDSQWHLNYLDRKKATNWLKLEKENRGEVPEKVLDTYPGSKRVTINLLSELTQVLSNPEIKRITFFISNNLKTWKPDEWALSALTQRIKLQGKQVDFAMYPPKLTNLSAREVAAALEVKGLYQIKIISSPPRKDYPSLLQVEYSNGDILHYFTEKESTEFSEKWGTSNGPVYRGHVSTGFQYTPWTVDLTNLLDKDKMVFEFKIKELNSSLFKFFNTIMQPEKDKWDQITRKIKHRNVVITYQDIYLKDALGCLILLNLLKSFRDEFNLTIQSLNLHLSAYNNPYINIETPSIDKDWGDSRLRTSFLKDASKAILRISAGVNEDKFLPHWRELVLSANDFELVIRPNGGIRNGWKLDNNQTPINQSSLDYSKDIKLFNQSQREGILYNIVFDSRR